VQDWAHLCYRCLADKVPDLEHFPTILSLEAERYFSLCLPASIDTLLVLCSSQRQETDPSVSPMLGNTFPLEINNFSQFESKVLGSLDASLPALLSDLPKYYLNTDTLKDTARLGFKRIECKHHVALIGNDRGDHLAIARLMAWISETHIFPFLHADSTFRKSTKYDEWGSFIKQAYSTAFYKQEPVTLFLEASILERPDFCIDLDIIFNNRIPKPFQESLRTQEFRIDVEEGSAALNELASRLSNLVKVVISLPSESTVELVELIRRRPLLNHIDSLHYCKPWSEESIAFLLKCVLGSDVKDKATNSLAVRFLDFICRDAKTCIKEQYDESRDDLKLPKNFLYTCVREFKRIYNSKKKASDQQLTRLRSSLRHIASCINNIDEIELTNIKRKKVKCYVVYFMSFGLTLIL
jgi:hypothetical protein